MLSPELLKVLCEMGHGDELVVVDANFTAASLGRGKPLIRLPGVGLARACRAVLSVFPLDQAVAQPAAYMKVEDRPDGFASEVQREVIALAAALAAAGAHQFAPVERFSFYERVGRAYAIVQTGEAQPYANFIFKKGVIGAAQA